MKEAEQLLERLNNGVAPQFVVLDAIDQLAEEGFELLSMEKPWDLKAGGKYMVNQHESSLVAFTMPSKILHQEELANRLENASPYLRIAAAHTDYPALRIKATPDMKTGVYGKINTEVYGGAINPTWMDRPLGVAGRVSLKSDDVFAPRTVLYQSDRPVLIIPNLAIHMNRDVNKGVELNPQKDMLPLFTTDVEHHTFVDFLAEELEVSKEEILDFELTCFATEQAEYVGVTEDMISAPRIDNISSVESCIYGLLDAGVTEHMNMAVLFDHEEIGSRSNKGAASAFLRDLVEKIFVSTGVGAEMVIAAIYQGMTISADVAHAYHPNYPDKEDVTNQPVLNGGFCIKEASSQSYATDAEAISIVEQICKKHEISYQKFVNRSDLRGGSTLGAISSALLPMKTVDIGIPILAMHSARELMGTQDIHSLNQLIGAFFKEV
jgi:aspartyl aminopeptidase